MNWIKEAQKEWLGKEVSEALSAVRDNISESLGAIEAVLAMQERDPKRWPREKISEEVKSKLEIIRKEVSHLIAIEGGRY